MSILEPVMQFSEVQNNIWERVKLFLHFLMVTPALFGFAGSNEVSHCLEDLIKPPHLLTDEVVVIDLQEPMVSFVLLN